jgi:hypothetical protein
MLIFYHNSYEGVRDEVQLMKSDMLQVVWLDHDRQFADVARSKEFVVKGV